MSGALGADLAASAGVLGVLHTLLGPDHVVPFVVLGRLRGWSLARTVSVALLCGVAHVAASLALGAVGLAAGAAAGWLEQLDHVRGSLGAWLLVGGGGAYALWGLRVALGRRGGFVPHAHGRTVHLHRGGDRPHDHPMGDRPHRASAGDRLGFWVLFLLLVFGPCEPLVPLFFLPASRGAWSAAWVMAAVFAAGTLVTMAVLVGLACAGASLVRLGRAARWSHALAGLTLCLAGGSALWF